MSILEKTTWGDLRRRSLFIATPMYGGTCSGGYATSILQVLHLFQKNGISCMWHHLGNESLIQRARNYLVDDFMRSGYTHLLFVDADIEFNANDILHMFAYADYHSNYDILCGPYPKKNIAWEKVKYAYDLGMINIPDDTPPEQKFTKLAQEFEKYTGDFVVNFAPGTHTVKMNEPVEVMEGGTGLMLIQRRTFERFADAYPDLYYRPDHKRSPHFNGSRKIMCYFDSVIDRGVTEQEIWDLLRRAARGEKVTKEANEMVSKHKKSSLRYWSEDYFFCQLARKIGLKVWLCPWVKSVHYGTARFTGSLEALLRINANATVDTRILQGKQNVERSNQQN